MSCTYVHIRVYHMFITCLSHVYHHNHHNHHNHVIFFRWNREFERRRPIRIQYSPRCRGTQ